MRLQDKIAIVTGAGSGFGAEIARQYATEGARVVVNDIDEEAGEAVAKEIVRANGAAIFHRADVALDAQVKGLVAAALEAYGGLDIMVNNAGYTHPNRPMTEVDEETFDRIFAVNVKSIYLAVQHAVPVFRGRGGGLFINIASTAGLRPRPGLTCYNASKGAAITMTKSMAVEFAPDNIRVCAINPVIGETGLLETFMGVPDTPENRAKFMASIPLGRFSKPSDIANAALFLADDSSEFLTGMCIEVDGGRCV